MTPQPPVILITGGAQGIGKGIAVYFLGKDWRVVVLDQDAEAIKACRQDLGNPDNLHLIEMDVSRESEVVSPEARFETGQNFVIDGGMTRKMIYQD